MDWHGLETVTNLARSGLINTLSYTVSIPGVRQGLERIMPGPLPDPDSTRYMWKPDSLTILIPFYGEPRDNPRIMDTRRLTEDHLNEFVRRIGMDGIIVIECPVMRLRSCD